MRPKFDRFLCQTVVMTLALGFVACTDTDTPLNPSVRALFTTPTGLVTANPPQIFVGAGDISSCGNNNDEATAKIIDTIPGTVFVLGDDAYDNGSTTEFTNCYDPTWGRFKSRTKPSPGNHEYNTNGASGYYGYFGAAAGDPTKGYYSYALGAWHIIVLNSNISLNSGGAQDTWLKADLAAHPNQCTLAYYHHPLYSSDGGTGTGGLTYSSSRMFVNDLYAAHADLILNGHRHFYERLAPMNPSGVYDSLNGVRELIAGTGGIGGGDETNLFPLHQAGDGHTFGVLKLWLYDDSYAWKFIPVAGKTYTDSGSTPCHSSAGGGGGGVSASNSTVAASPTSFTAGGSSTITVTVKDGSGKAISGATVVLASTGTGNTLTQPSSTTDSSGVATGTLSATVAEVKTVSATANGVAITQTANVTITPGAVSASKSTVTASPTSIAVSSGPATVTVTAKDANGNVISGATVALAATGSGNTFTPSSGTTNASGVVTSSFSSTVAESKTISATIGGTAITQTATVTVTSGAVVSPSLSTVSASPTSITAGNGTSTITVTVRDGSGSPVSGASVALSATGTGNTITQPSGVTGSDGVATGSLASTKAEGKTVTATANGTTITQTASITVAAGAISPTQSTLTAQPTSFVAGSGSSTVTVTAKDANGNPVGQAAVVVSVSGSGNTITQPVGPTDATGVATGSFTSTVAEAKSVSSTVGGVLLTQTVSVTVTAAPPPGGVVLVGAGNVADCSSTMDDATAAILDTIAGTVFTPGDNIIGDGTLNAFTSCYTPSWGRHKARVKPAVGYQEYKTAGAPGYWQYFGSVVGDSGKYYYSYDLGSWHIVVLNDQYKSVPIAAGSAQELWLKADLAATSQPCILAIWSQPRFSSSQTAPRDVTLPAWNDLYAAKADIVLNGDFVNYERFAPQKPDGTSDPAMGIRQFVVGTGGRMGFTAFVTTAPNSEVRNNATWGVLKLTLGTGSYSWQFVPVGAGGFTDSGSGTCH